MPLNPSRVAVPTIPGPIATIVASACDDVPRDRERAVHRDRFVVAAERVPAGDRRVEQLAVAELRDEIGERERQRGAVGHHVREPEVGARAA